MNCKSVQSSSSLFFIVKAPLFQVAVYYENMNQLKGVELKKKAQKSALIQNMHFHMLTSEIHCIFGNVNVDSISFDLSAYIRSYCKHAAAR
jgi:hypothetical protein